MEIVPGFTALQIFAEIQKMMIDMKCEPKQFQGRIIFLSMCNDIERGQKKETEKLVLRILLWFQSALKLSHEDSGRFLRLDQTRSCSALTKTNQM